MPRFVRWSGPEWQLLAAFVLVSSGLAYFIYQAGVQVERNGALVQVVSNQRVQIQNLMRRLLEIGLAAEPDRPAAQAALGREVSGMSATLSTLREGGNVEASPGLARQRIIRGSIPASAEARFDQFDQQWQQFAARLGSIVDPARTLDDTQLQRAFEYARTNEPVISEMAAALLDALHADSARVAGRSQKLQVSGLALAVGFFVLLVSLYSGQLRRVRAAQRETTDILQTVPAGLFLLDPKLRLGDQHSAQLARILQRDNLAGRDFFDLLTPMVSPETLVTARDYIQLLLGDRVNEHLVASLNPLDEVEVQVPGELGRLEKRWLGFTFKRVLEHGKLSHLLVTLTDVTDRVLLARRLEQAEAASDQQAERLLDLFLNLTHVEHGLLEARLERWERLLREANEVLKRQAGSQDEFHQLINQVFRPIHALKGEASALDLGVIVQRAAAVERELADLRTRQFDLTGNDFLPVTVRLEDLFAQFDAVRRVTRRLSDLSNNGRAKVSAGSLPASAAALATPLAPAPAAGPAPKRASAWQMARELCRRAAASLGKQADLELVGLDDALVPEHLRQPLLDVLMQLVRNSVAHGIELPAERTRQGKGDVGHVSAHFTRLADGSFEFSFRDDGRGIDFERIRERAVSLGKLSAPAAKALEPRQLAGLIFEPGFSTAELPGDNSGRGVGLDLVRERIKHLGGQIGVATGQGQYTQFKIRLPAVLVAA